MYRTVLALATALLLVSSLSNAQPRRERVHIDRVIEAREDFKDRLNLTEDQQSKMHKMRVELQKKRIDQQAKIRVARLDLKEMLAADKPDRAAIEKALKSISDMQHQLKLVHIDHLLSARAMLTPEQQKIWKEHMTGPQRGPFGPGPRMQCGRPLRDAEDD